MALFFLLITVHLLCIGYCLNSSGYNLYHTYHPLTTTDHDCLYYFTPQIDSTYVYQFLQYCIRSSLHDEEVSDDMDNNDNQFTFDDLRRKNITSDQLYDWSAPIDLIEYYQDYLETNLSRNNFVFYNCTYPWFGSRCEYSLGESRPHFGEHLEKLFIDKGTFYPENLMIPTCYIHLECDRVGDHGQTAGACLDWREICDGKVDCIDGGKDEESCWQLELNECDEKTEFRCDIGLCIPLAFLRDDGMNPDCLDRSDELVKLTFRNYVTLDSFICFQDPAFRCEDRRGHPSTYRNHTIECGDGSYTTIENSCMNERSSKLLDRLWLGKNLSADCRLSILCFTKLYTVEFILEHCTSSDSKYANDIAQYCPPIIVLQPVMFGHVRFVYTNNQTQKINSSINLYYVIPDYICYNNKLCDPNLFSILRSLPIDLLGINSTCRSFNELVLYKNKTFVYWSDVMNGLYQLFRKCSNYHQLTSILGYSNLYQCINSSKIISQHRLLDGIEDCLYGDDESYEQSCSLKHFNHRFRCDSSNNNTKCIVRSSVLDGHPDCLDQSDENAELRFNLAPIISFQILCDGYTDLPPILIDGHNETDETECDYFSCNNIYTRCDKFWNCPDGADEINCEWPPMCPPLHHMCLSPRFGNLTCLHMRHINDGIIHCLGASDERRFCRENMKNAPGTRYRCWESDQCIGIGVTCVKPPQCLAQNNYSTYFCQDIRVPQMRICKTVKDLKPTEEHLCSLSDQGKKSTIHFSIFHSTSYLSKEIQTKTETAMVLRNSEINDDPITDDIKTTWYCNRGVISLRRSLRDKNSTKIICFCPPAYYGDLCQYQNQRVSLTMHVRASFDFRTQFAIIITLRDDQQHSIESYDQINYLYERDCRKKFNIYLIYSTRPKSTSTNHSVHIDIFDKETLKHRTSWLFPIKFPFLPVYRLAIQIQIPAKKLIAQDCHTLNCGNHGNCSQYENTKTLFCLCDEEWSGKYCNISYTRHCLSNSLSFASNICVCPIQKFGSRCYLRHPICTCKNNGTCVRNDERINQEIDQWCICPKGFSGSQCELVDMTYSLSFASDVSIPRNILVHFIGVSGKTAPHSRSTVPVKIPIDQETVSIFRSIPFHIVFVEIIRPQTYYLSLIQQQFDRSMNISSIIKGSDRCQSINELFNETIVKWHPLRRMKYYHIPCQQQSDLVCFYDDDHMCICSSDLRQANCMIFNRLLSYECEDENQCANGGRCFRDNPICPTSFMCECDECSYGSQCQVSTRGLGLSLDVILAYHIKPYRSFKDQDLVIHVTTGIVIIMLIFGIVSSLLSIVTFHTKKAREVGCGYYLLVSSYISLIIISTFTLKFIFLVISQMGLITNQNYLTFNCIVFELLLRVLLSSGDWLNSFVGIERVISVMKSIKFNKIKAKRIAKWIIVVVCIVTTTTHIHDPIYRRMIDDTLDQRSWCHVKFSSSVELYNTIILALHFGFPFLLNIITAVIIIVTTARQRAIAQKQQSYRQQLHKQLTELKHLLISPVILIALASPRLVISFTSGCINTTRGSPWLYLSGYLISIFPSMLIVVVFVVPSDVYKNELKIRLTRLQNYIRHGSS